MSVIELVKIQNPSQRGDENFYTLHMVHQDEVIDIEPGGERIVPLEIAVSFFGHPNFRDEPRNKVRSETYQQLKFMWGYQSGALDAEEHWARIRPPFQVVTLNGEYMPMILDDPEGKLPQPGDTTGDLPASNADVAVLQAAVVAQQAQIAQLMQLIAAKTVDANPGIVPDDPDAPVLNAGVDPDPTNLPKAGVDEQLPVKDGPRQPSSRRGTTING